MKKILKTLGLGIFFLIFFLILTFPFSRLLPKARQLLQDSLRNALGSNVTCDIEGLGFSLPMGLAWSAVNCDDAAGKSLIALSEGSLSLWLGSQTLRSSLGKNSSMHLSADAGLKGNPSRITIELEKVSLEKLTPMLLALLGKANPGVASFAKGAKLLGAISGRIDMPLKNFKRASGQVDLNIEGLKLPSQSLLDLIGLPELSFTKSAVKATLNAGKLNISEANFISSQLSGKAEGTAQLDEPLSKSIPNITVKWKVEKSDALRSTPWGKLLTEAPCPSPDSDSFCTKRIARMSDLSFSY